jgi:predicted enzyme related to lactoylglutathione lyase
VSSPAPSPVHLASLGQIALTVHDIDRAVTFYRDTLGVPHLFTVPPRLAFFDCAGIRLMLGLPEGNNPGHPGAILYFRVTGIEETHQSLVAQGVSFTDAPHLIARMPDHELWMAFFRDPDGNILALMEEKR